MVVATLLWGIAGPSFAASVWNPTLLVNTESFSTIDDGDGTTPIQLRFGDTLRETITYNRSAARFDFSRSIFVGGSITATGSLNIKGNITATGSLSIKGGMSGSSLRVDKNADIWGNLGVSGTTILDGNVGVGVTGAPQTKLEVVGTISGSTVDVTGPIAASGALSVGGNTNLKGTLNVTGAATFGSTIKLNTVTYTFPSADGAAGTVLQTAGNGTLSWTNPGVAAQSFNDGRYVNQAGDTMTGALMIRPTTAGEAALEVNGTASGRILSFAQRLTGSGNVFIRTATDSATAFQVFKSSGTNPVLNVDTTNERVGVGTATPLATLDVNGVAATSLGTVSAPGFAFRTDLNTGMWSAGDDTIDFAAGGVNLVRMTGQGLRTMLGGSASSPALGFVDANLGFFRPAADTLALTTNGAEKMRWTSGGDVGIGTTAPETKLEVVGTISGSTVSASSGLTSSGTLAVEGNVAFGGTIKINGQTYTFPSDAGANGKVLTTNGAGTLSWTSPSVGVGSGGVLFLSP